MNEVKNEEWQPKFGELFPTLPIDDFHAINAATIHHAPTTNEDLMRLIRLRPTWETLAPSSVTPHLLRRILSDNTAITVLTDTVAELREQLATLKSAPNMQDPVCGTVYSDAEAFTASQARATACPCGCPRPGIDNMCCCTEPCPCSPCGYCDDSADGSAR